MNDWPDLLGRLVREGTRCVLVSVVQVHGSAPREAGARMIVTGEACLGTIGGGNLEWQAQDLARRCLAGGEFAAFVQRFALGPALGQCCGGVVDLSFLPVGARDDDWITELVQHRERDEAALLAIPLSGAVPRVVRRGEPTPATGMLLDPVPAPAMHVVLFGAGHVGRALVPLLAEALPCRITWVDDRPGQFPAQVPPCVVMRGDGVALDVVPQMPAGACCLVMTHSHALDQAICSAILRRGDAAFLGLIGSATKRRHFVRRLRAAGHTEAQLQHLVCPIGIAGIASKRPSAIAIAVAAQLLHIHGRRTAAPDAAIAGIAESA